MKVKNHKDFCCFEYTSTTEKTHFELGDVVIRFDPLDVDDLPEIGVVIQVHDCDEVRTDMFGNACIDDLLFATYEEIKEYRKELLTQLKN